MTSWPEAVFTERTPRVAAARQLTRRSERESAKRFLVEGAQAVREALAWAAAGSGRVYELFVTERAAARAQELVATAHNSGIPVSLITERAAASLSETVTPQGIIAICDLIEVPLAQALLPPVSLVAVLISISDPGNAGTVLRVADAAGADAVIFAGDTVDPHNGKCVRASTGSIFHLPVTRVRDLEAALDACADAGLQLLAADGGAQQDVDAALQAGALAQPSAWLFGSEAHGVPENALNAADLALRVPIYGKAESLNLATAAAVCLYASARAQR